MRIHNKLKR